MNLRKFEHFEPLLRNFLCIRVGGRECRRIWVFHWVLLWNGRHREVLWHQALQKWPRREGEPLHFNDWKIKEDTGFQITIGYEACWGLPLLRSLLFSLQEKSLWKSHSEIIWNMESSECMPGYVFFFECSLRRWRTLQGSLMWSHSLSWSYACSYQPGGWVWDLRESALIKRSFTVCMICPFFLLKSGNTGTCTEM